MLKYGEDYGKYNKFFKSKALDTYNENLVTAKIGTSAVTIKDLKSLAPKEYLNDTIINCTTALLASICADYNAKKKTPVKVAVFDSRFASLIIEHPMNSDPSCCNYTRVRGYGDRRLHRRSPLSFERLVFANNIRDNRWIIIVVFPKQSLIVAVDSLRMERPVAAARTIFRWLYDETRYHWPADNTKMFGSHRPDRGWVFRVDSTVSQQIDTWNCGVFVLGYVVCFLFGMNPNKLKHDLIEDYLVRLFCNLFDEQVLVDPTRIVSPPPPPSLG
jgi:Ulp1 family protease